MRQEDEALDRTASFVIRIWWMEEDAQTTWRGWAQHATSGESRYFHTLAEVLEFVGQHSCDLRVEKGREQKPLH